LRSSIVDQAGSVGGPGSAARDTNLYRSSAGVVKTDQSLHVTQNLRINTTSLGGGSGVIAIANATTVPSTPPTGGGVLYVRNGALISAAPPEP
jgi:hypothetical protein